MWLWQTAILGDWIPDPDSRKSKVHFILLNDFLEFRYFLQSLKMAVFKARDFHSCFGFKTTPNSPPHFDFFLFKGFTDYPLPGSWTPIFR